MWRMSCADLPDGISRHYEPSQAQLRCNSITNERTLRVGGRGRRQTIRIDVHNHVMPERALALLREDDAYGVTLDGRRWSGGMHVDFEIVPSFVEPGPKLAELESKGLEAAVVSVAPPLFYYHLDAEAAGEPMARAVNRGLAEFCAEAPDRLRWLATVPMQDPERAAAVLEDSAGRRVRRRRDRHRGGWASPRRARRSSRSGQQPSDSGSRSPSTPPTASETRPSTPTTSRTCSDSRSRRRSRSSA